MVGVITESKILVEQAEKEEKGEFVMCTALEKLERRGVERGIEQGIERTKKEMVLRMLEQGADIGFIETVSALSRKEIEKIEREAKA